MSSTCMRTETHARIREIASVARDKTREKCKKKKMKKWSTHTTPYRSYYIIIMSVRRRTRTRNGIRQIKRL